MQLWTCRRFGLQNYGKQVTHFCCLQLQTPKRLVLQLIPRNQPCSRAGKINVSTLENTGFLSLLFSTQPQEMAELSPWLRIREFHMQISTRSIQRRHASYEHPLSWSGDKMCRRVIAALHVSVNEANNQDVYSNGNWKNKIYYLYGRSC